METTINYNGVEITLKRGTVKTRINSDMLVGRLNTLVEGKDLVSFGYRSAFASFMNHISAMNGELPNIKIVNSASSDKDIINSYNAFLDADEALYDAIEGALLAITMAYTEKKFQPPDRLTAEEKKITPESEAN